MNLTCLFYLKNPHSLYFFYLKLACGILDVGSVLAGEGGPSAAAGQARESSAAADRLGGRTPRLRQARGPGAAST